MGSRLRAVAVVAIVLLAGAFIGSAASQWWGLPVGSRLGGPRTQGLGDRVRVEVLNGGGVQGAAGEATDALRDAGFDVVLFGNLLGDAGDFDQDSSVVLDRVGELEAARAVADVLGIPNVRSEPDSNLYLDVSVVLGRDWTPVDVGIGREESTVRAWWDPRGWFGS